MDHQVAPSGSTYRRMTEQDLEAAHRLSQLVRWPHRLQDWQFNHRLGIGYMAEIGETVVGTILYWNHGTEFASLGMVIVHPGWQGKGIGRKLMALAMDELGKRNTILMATEAGMPLYQGLGFEAVGAIHQHQASAFRSEQVALQAGERIRPLGAGDGAQLAALYARAAGMPRDTVLATLMEVSECVVIDRDDELIGFAMLRPYGRGHLIGPLIAPDAERAKALIRHWTGIYTGSFVRIDVPAASGLSPWLDELGLPQVDTVVTMVRGEAPPDDKAMQVFALVNQAIG